MSWVESFSLVMRSNVTALREKVEDPERLLHQLIIDMEEEQVRVREAVAAAIADEILIRKRLQKSREEVDEWMARATSALQSSDEEQAKAALEQRGLAEERADGLEEEYRKQKEQTESLQRSVRDLEDKTRQARQKQTVLLARLTRAESHRKIDRAMRRADGRSAFNQFSRLEDRVDRAEAMSEAYDRLDGKDTDAEALKRACEERRREEKLAEELESLKKRLDDAPQA